MADIPAGKWAIDPVHSSVGFEVKHLGVSTYRGSFAEAIDRKSSAECL